MGQVYVASINYALMLATMALVVGFGSSSRLAAAYGIAVTLNMTITTILAYVIARQVWGWGRVVADPGRGGIPRRGPRLRHRQRAQDPPRRLGGAGHRDGGLHAAVHVEDRARACSPQRLRERAYPLARLLERIEQHPPIRVPGTAVFMAGTAAGAPPPLLHNLQYNKVMHEQVILLTVTTAERPHVPPAERATVERLADRFYRVTLDYGFMDQPDVPLALARLPPESGLRVDMAETAFFLGRETLLATRRPGMFVWRERLFALHVAQRAARDGLLQDPARARRRDRHPGGAVAYQCVHAHARLRQAVAAGRARPRHPHRGGGEGTVRRVRGEPETPPHAGSGRRSS